MKRNLICSDSIFQDEFLYGAARAFFVTAYADHVDSQNNPSENGEEPDGYEWPSPGCGGDWYDYAPEEMPAYAYVLAGQLWEALERVNKCSVYALANRATEADGKGIEEDWERGSGLVIDLDAEEFGRDLAMMAMGTGVSWFDDHKKFEMIDAEIECTQYSFDWSRYAELIELDHA